MTEQLHRIEWTAEGTYTEEWLETQSLTFADEDTPHLRAVRAKLAQLDAAKPETPQQWVVVALIEEFGADREKAELVADRFRATGLLAPDEPPKLLIDYLNENGWTNYQITRLAAVPLSSMDHLCRAAVVEAEAAGRDLS